jgi:hypothetical protein
MIIRGITAPLPVTIMAQQKKCSEITGSNDGNL